MPNNNDERDEKSVGCVEIDRTRLGRLFMITDETIDFEDHGDFVIVDVDDLRWLENMASELAKEFARDDDDTD